MPTVDRRGGVVDASSPNPSGGPNPGLAIKAPVRVATIGSNIVLSGLQTLDGVTLCAGDRVLVKDQTNAAQNGVYIAGSGTWLMAPDWLGPPNAVNAGVPGFLLTQRLLVAVAQGAINAGALFELASPGGKIDPGHDGDHVSIGGRADHNAGGVRRRRRRPFGVWVVRARVAMGSPVAHHPGAVDAARRHGRFLRGGHLARYAGAGATVVGEFHHRRIAADAD